jgi:hypothetical protein
MKLTRVVLALALAVSILAYGCSAIVAAYLVNQLLNDKAPKKTWSGHVKDSTGDPVAGVKVEVRGTVAGDSNIATFADETDATGYFAIAYRWNQNVEYAIRVTQGNVELVSIDYGTIDKSDRVSELTINGAVNVVLSGIVKGPDGQPLQGVLVVGASVGNLDETPVAFQSGGKTEYKITNDAGIYTLTGAVSKYGIVCAYHPDHGFAYQYDEDDNHNGDIPIKDIVMGAVGEYTVKAQVVDNSGTPLTPQVLSPGRQFRLRLKTPFNLSDAVNVVVAENGLFPGLAGDPGDTHPAEKTLIVQAVGASGFSTSTMQVPGSTYQIYLLNIGDDNPATALVFGTANPMPLYQNSTVVVKVN